MIIVWVVVLFVMFVMLSILAVWHSLHKGVPRTAGEDQNPWYKAPEPFPQQGIGRAHYPSVRELT